MSGQDDTQSSSKRMRKERCSDENQYKCAEADQEEVDIVVVNFPLWSLLAVWWIKKQQVCNGILLPIIVIQTCGNSKTWLPWLYFNHHTRFVKPNHRIGHKVLFFRHEIIRLSRKCSMMWGINRRKRKLIKSKLIKSLCKVYHGRR